MILYGAGHFGKMAYHEYGENVRCFMDSNKEKVEFCGLPVISLENYLESNMQDEIVISTIHYADIIKMLIKNGIEKYSIYPKVYMSEDVSKAKEIAHSNWPSKIKEIADFEGFEILEVGSRVVTGANFRGLFERANYTGFDLYEGPNVDVVGDAHKLSQYFNKKFDMIFCSAVFEHLAMPWVVADEMIKLCKKGGYIFIETHYSFANHERPWHFFQFSEQALKVLFSEKRGIKCIEAGVSNPIIGFFADESSPYLRGRPVGNMYCHSGFLGQKVEEVQDLSWGNHVDFENMGMYPQRIIK